MIPVQTIIVKLQEASEWEDGESLATIQEQLTPEQREAPGKLTLRIAERGPLPWLVCARVEQGGNLLFEVKRCLPDHISHSDVEIIVREWQALGYLEKINITPKGQG